MDKSSSDGVPPSQHYGVTPAIVLELTMAVLGGAIANVVPPTIASDLNASPAMLIWIVSTYQIAIVIALLPLSFPGDMVGCRHIYKIGLMVFVFTLLAYVLSRNPDMLTFAHVAQGLGDAVLISVNTTLIRLVYPQHFLGRGTGTNSFVVAVSSTAGPMIAVAILSFASWRWLSLINVPLGIVTFVLVIRFLPPDSARSEAIRFDLSSAVTNAPTFRLLITALSGFAQGRSVRLVLTEVAATLMAGFFFVCRQLSMPILLLPVNLLRIPLFSLSICTSICSFCAQMLVMVPLPSFLQTMMRHGEVKIGLPLMPWSLMTMVTAPLTGCLIKKCHAGLLGAIGLLVMAYSPSGLAPLPESPSDLDIIWRTALCGAGFGLLQSPNNRIIAASAPDHHSGDAGGMLGAVHLLGQSAGTTPAALLFSLFSNSGTHTTLLLVGILAIVAALISGLHVTQSHTT